MQIAHRGGGLRHLLVCAVQFGSDVLVVPNANITARYNIGVFAFRNSSFTITAYVQNQHDTRSVVTLVDSQVAFCLMRAGTHTYVSCLCCVRQPQGGVVSHGGFRYYRIYTPQSGNLPGQLTVQLSRELGDPVCARKKLHVKPRP